MSLVRSHVFIAVRLAPGSAVVPSGKRWLVKYALVYNNSGSASASYSIQVQPAGGTNRQVFAGTIANQVTFVLPQPITLEQGDTLTVSSSLGTSVVAASGIEFTP